MTAKPKSPELPNLFFSDPSSFETWLADNHSISSGIRLQFAKKSAAIPSVTYDEALDISLCYGWIDSQKEAMDDRFWLQRFTPRGRKSIWSQVNKDKAERLIAEGRMQSAGFAAIETAKQNGEWDKAYASQSNATMPEDFALELEGNDKARAFYETLNRQNQYAILFRIHQAKKPETRVKRIQQFLAMLEQGEKLYP